MLGSILGVSVIALLLATLCSVSMDLTTYSVRQDEWEAAHPGATYVPGFNRLSEAEKATYR